jgi:O-antigen/teichoic acid export membrane protein
MRPLVYVEAVQGAIVLGLGSYFLMRHLNLRAVIYAEVIASFAGAAFTAGFVQRLRAGTSHLKATWKMIWTATGTFNIFPLITNIYDRIDVVLLSVIAGSAAAGLYALPYRALATLQIIPFGLMAAVLPVLASRAPSISDREICLRMGTGLAVLSMFPALILTLLARPLVLSVLGREYAASIPILRLLAWAAIPMFLNYGLNTFLLSRSRERAFLWTSSICAIVNVVLNLILIPRFSYYAAAAVTIMTELLLLVHNLLIIRKIFSFVALPKRLLVTAAILLALAAIGLASNLSFSPLFTVTAACAAFSAYLYFDGSFEAIVSELRAS